MSVFLFKGKCKTSCNVILRFSIEHFINILLVRHSRSLGTQEAWFLWGLGDQPLWFTEFLTMGKVLNLQLQGSPQRRGDGNGPHWARLTNNAVGLTIPFYTRGNRGTEKRTAEPTAGRQGRQVSPHPRTPASGRVQGGAPCYKETNPRRPRTSLLQLWSAGDPAVWPRGRVHLVSVGATSTGPKTSSL